MSVPSPTTTPEFVAAEEAGWRELDALVAGLSPEEAERPGYTSGGWSVKDLLAHLAGWLSEAGRVLGQVGRGTFEATDPDVDARNALYVEANRDQPLATVVWELHATRHRLLRMLHGSTDIPPLAQPALEKAGPHHYAEHLPRLREWVAELQAQQAQQ